MIWLVLAIAMAALAALLVVLLGRRADAKEAEQQAAMAASAAEASARTTVELQQRILALVRDNDSLQSFKDIRDTAAEATRIREAAQAAVQQAEAAAAAIREAARVEAAALMADAQSNVAEAERRVRAELQTAGLEAAAMRRSAETEASGIRSEARTQLSNARDRVTALLSDAHAGAEKVVKDADARAEQIAGDAYRALREAEQVQAVAKAMENVIDGYGDRYLVPTYSLLDQLAENYAFEEAGRELKAARDLAKSLVASGRAAACEYVEANRRTTALRFVLDAFNGKVETVLARVKSDNVGTLEQQIRDAFALVNHNGEAFRNAKVTAEYLSARLQELKWAAAVVALRERDKEEQRRIREQIREEERAQREIDRALRDAAKEEDTLQRAMAKVLEQVAKASDEQRVAFEVQLQELQGRLAEALARNERARSMAQQTKSGYVYVISNVGAFGENIYKIGMTRRLEPIDRVRELGDASVPFGFDVHAMIWTEDAPNLERTLHKQFVTCQVNKVNPRKEFFRVAVADIRECVDAIGLKAVWTMAATAAQHHETMAIERALAENTIEAKNWLRAQMQFTPDLPHDEIADAVSSSLDLTGAALATEADH